MAKKRNINKKYLIAGIATIIVLILIISFWIFSNNQNNQINSLQKENCGEGTTIYKYKNLCWQKSVMHGKAKWDNAKTYCENLVLGGHDDWRLPEVGELTGIVNKDYAGVSIDTNYFTDTTKIYYWTATPYIGQDNFHWYVHFEIGQQGYAPDFKENGVRCVRDNTIF